MLSLPIDEQFAVIEAPTGTGKTEAALIWASRLVEAGHVVGPTSLFLRDRLRRSFTLGSVA